jgi:hypothetical protein
VWEWFVKCRHELSNKSNYQSTPVYHHWNAWQLVSNVGLDW